MDEFHYFGDKERGTAWQIPLISLPETQFLLMSATLGDMSSLVHWLESRTGQTVAQVRGNTRPVPLEFHYSTLPLHETIQQLLRENKAPVYLVGFTQRNAVESAQNLLSIDFLSKADKDKLKEALVGFRFDTPFGKELSKLLRHGVGLHHAGLLPKYRRLVERLAQQGLLKVVSGTDTLGVGVNIPIRTVLLTQLCKFDGEKTALLSVREFLQITGRAGRKGFDVKGFVVAQAPAHVIENLKLSQRRAEGKKVVMQKPPTKGYVHWDEKTFERLQTQACETLVPRFELSHGLLMQLLQAWEASSAGGYAKLVELVLSSMNSPAQKLNLLRQAKTLLASLVDAELVSIEKRSSGGAARLVLLHGLQKDFSLNHTLSLFLLSCLPFLDTEAPTHALDVLSAVESILENPFPILYAQLNQLKTQKIAQLKADGVPFEERMEELEKLEWPKPLADFLYGTFNSFAKVHPWLLKTNISPKSVARDLFERGMSFNEYIRELGAARSEGILLRYVGQAYKTLLQNIPSSQRNEGTEEILAFLRAFLSQVDSSLLEEWEGMHKAPAPLAEHAPAETTSPGAGPSPEDLAKNKKALLRRIRAEVHLLSRQLALGLWEEAALHLREDAALDAKALEETVSPYLKTHGPWSLTPLSRQAQWTRLEPGHSPRHFVISHILLNAEGEAEGSLEGEVDLSGESFPSGPLFVLKKIHLP
jgi:superfamily II RNA helicase